MDSDKSLGNGALDVSVTKKFGQRVQKIVSEESPVKKRCSPRLREIPEGKRPYYGPSRKASQQHPVDSMSSDATELENVTGLHQKDGVADNALLNSSPTSCLPNLSRNEMDASVSCQSSKGKSLVNEKDTAGAADRELKKGNEYVHKSGLLTRSKSELDSTASPLANEQNSLDFGVTVAHTRKDKARVKETLRIYNKYYLHFFQEQNVCENDGKQHAKHLDLKKEGQCESGGKRNVKRPDLKAISKMLECNEVLFPMKRFGHLPGIEVGYQFYSRAEMVAIGLHSHWLNGIDFMGNSYKKMEEFRGYTFPIAIAIVLSGQYEDDIDNSEDIVYTGQGGHDLTGRKHQIRDQEMSRGNLGLKNSKEQSIPIRVIRGHTSGQHKIYTYDGLYRVSEYWPAEGVSGFVVYKYRLKRLEGQPKLTSDQVHFSNGRSSRVPVKGPQLVCLDIADGQEDVLIPVTNTIDDATMTGFTYTKYNQVLSDLKLPPNADGCDCKGYCTNPRTCACARLNGDDFPYVRSNGGRLIEAKDVVFECGPNCGCGPGCINRISQRGLRYQLEVFRTSDRGWAVKTKDFIPSGAPVCEYIGELRRTNELDNVAENDYIFEIDCWQTIKGIGGRERRLGDVSVSISNELEKGDEKDLESSMPEPEFCIDAGRIGNVARFINHSCDPNLFVQCVLSSHHDLKLARIVLFAADNIPPMQELTYDYGYALDSVVDNNGAIRTLPCHCETSECRKRLY